MSQNPNLGPFIQKIHTAYAHDPTRASRVARQFSRLFSELDAKSGYINAATLMGTTPKDPRAVSHETLSAYTETGIHQIHRTLMLKLNGGLGTTLGLGGTKSAIVINPKTGDTFLDYVMKHTQSLAQNHGQTPKLVFLNSPHTIADTKRILKNTPYDELIQNKFPRINDQNPENRIPYENPKHPDDGWNPPGHGDLYTVMQLNGWLDAQIQRGFHYLFISNSDNLGATLDPAILGFLHDQSIDFVMEATPKTNKDKKGGSLITQDNRLHLIEVAQIDPDDDNSVHAFENFPLFNTNNIWIKLSALKKKLDQNTLHPRLIANHKQIHGTPIIQLETALGSVISDFEKTAVVIVDRSRFRPVKTKEDLEKIRVSL